jgi:hypothetical protein
VSDWLNAGSNAEDLKKIAAKTPRWKPNRNGDRLLEPKFINRHERDLDSLWNARRARRAVYGLAISPSEKLLMIMLTDVAAPQNDLAAYLRVTRRRGQQCFSRRSYARA